MNPFACLAVAVLLAAPPAMAQAPDPHAGHTMPGNDANAVQSHVRNFVEAMQGKAKLVAPIEVGQQAAISGHMATLSLRNNKKVLWDTKTQKHRFV